MIPITTWYKRQPNYDYRYCCFKYGHTTTEKSGWLYKNCYLDTSGKINTVIE